MLTKQSIKDLIASSLVAYFPIVTEKITADIDAHAGIAATTAKAGHMTTAQVTKLEGIAAGAEVNQNAVARVKVGDVTITAGAKQDTVTFVAGDNVTVTADAAQKTVTVAGNYQNFSTSAAGLVPAATQAGKFLGSAGWVNLPAASTNAAGIAQLNNATDASTVVNQAATPKAVADALTAAKKYADGVKDAIIGGADAAWDTLQEIQAALTEDGSVIGAINDSIAGKADADHTHVGADLAVGTYQKATQAADVTAADTIATAIGKVEYRVTSLAAGGAEKWATARNIKLTGAVTGNVDIDGSQNVTLNTTLSNLASNKVTAMSGYTKASAKAAIAATDSLNAAIGKLEYKMDSLQMKDLFGTDVTGATLANYGIANQVYTSSQGTALAGRVTTIENNMTALGGLETVNDTDVQGIITAVKAGITPKA